MKLRCIYLMRFYFTYFNKTALHIAIEKGYVEIIQLLLQCKSIDINYKSIFKYL